MVTRTQIDRLSSRIEEFAAHAKSNIRTCSTAREEVLRRLQVGSERMRVAADESGEPFPPALSRGERDDIIRRFHGFVAKQRASQW